MYRAVGREPLYKTWHCNDENMIMYIYSGSGSIVCSEKIYPIKKGVLCFVGAGKYHYTMPDNPNEYERSKIFISGGILNKILNLISDRSETAMFSERSFVYAQLDEKKAAEITAVFDEIKKYEKCGDISELLLLSGCIKLLAFLKEYSQESTAETTGFIAKAMEYINNNIFSDIGIDEICTAIHMSKYYFCTSFKKHTGMTVMKYILKTRIVLAKNMLTTEDMAITEISECCGFSSISYFCRVFREETGMTPMRYRRAGRK